jgi:ATP synthase protein I
LRRVSNEISFPEFEGFAMAGNRSPEDGNRRARDTEEAELTARLQRLGERLGNLQQRERRNRDRDGDGNQRPSANTAGLARALRLSSEFVAGIVVGGLIGWLVDRVAGISPWGLIVFVLLGFAAGTLNALRSAGLVASQDQPGDQN